ncbi:MAG: isoprenylcysteine carboxylmethyltransferase family protein [Burkholderiales bacterium]|nr:isoprenylcysteine carboxylmethyltransferase family protein [Burkholderiales bacterium]
MAGAAEGGGAWASPPAGEALLASGETLLAAAGPGLLNGLGLALAALAAAWVAWAAWTLARAGNPLRPGAPPRRFVDEGPFAWSRNPMATGAIASALGLGLALGGPAAGLAAAAALAWWSRRHIVREEAQLRSRFGGWYSDYAARVRRWI